MKFGAVPVNEAAGAILAHGIPAASLSKGIMLGEGHISALQQIGITEVTVAQLEDGDIDEDTAAKTVAEAIAPELELQGLRLTKPATGRVNIFSVRAGLLELDVNRITALNRIDPMITLATLPDLSRVVAGTMLATIKIISYGVAQDALTAACAAICTDTPHQNAFAVTIRTAHLKTATLIETHHAGGRPAPKGRRVLDERLDRLGATLVETLDVPHDVHAIGAAIGQAKGQVIFILTASATSDIRDTAPSALESVGGKIEQFGMPVDPGNLLFLGNWQGKSVIGLPGCARSPALNGADWVMERVMCGLPVGAEDISAMGVGGLLKDIPERGRARG
jgi:molybdenum cofactor cytidylyltransferase